MKSFFKYVFATLTGIILFFVFWIIILVILVSSLNTDKEAFVAQNSVLTITLRHAIAERSASDPFEGLEIPGFSFTSTLGLDDILARIKGAATDERIKGIYLNLSSVSASSATQQEIRDALVEFKKSGKFIIAYSEVLSQSGYFIASTADKIYLHPVGDLTFNGFSSEVTFFAGALEKLGIEMQVVKVGTYKSAVEPFILKEMSDENKEQVAAYVGSLYNNFLTEIATSRQIHRDTLFAIADQMRVRSVEDAVAQKLADGLKYKDEVLAELKELLGVQRDRDIKSISLARYTKPAGTKTETAKDRVAIVYAVGDIVSGEGSDTQIGSERISRELRRVRQDSKVKAVVFRINSPGGSALASDVIWREVELLREEKPVIVSMGDVAASGGYYIAAAADSIFAQPNTITGSIGVFGLIPNMQSLFNDKLGLTFDGVKTGKYADFLTNVDRPLTAEERNILQTMVSRTYDTFTKKVSAGRNITQAQVDSVGQGRVWSGQQALAIGLVDRLGGIQDAIDAAAGMAKLESYQVVKYPTLRQPFESIFATSSDKIGAWFTRRELGEHAHYYEKMKSVLQQSGIQARLPYAIDIY